MHDWEEHTFVGLRALYRRVFTHRAERARAAVRATLAERRQSLLLLGQMIAGKSLTLFETSNAQLCADDRIFLPRAFELATTSDGNAELFTLKTILAALALREGWQRDGALLPDLAQRCGAEFPGLAEKIAAAQSALPPDTDLWRLMGALPTLQPATSDRDHLLGDLGGRADDGGVGIP